MQHRIFLRYFTICAIIILSSLLLMGGFSAAYLANSDYKEATDNMESAALKLAGVYSEMPKNYEFLSGAIIESSVSVIKDTLNADVFMVEKNGKVRFSTLDVSNVAIPQNALESVLEGEKYVNRGRFLKVEGKPGRVAYTVGVPVVIGDNNISAAVFITTTEVSFDKMIWPILFVLLSFSMVVMFFALVINFFVTRQMFKPLTQMSKAAKAYANGDFSMRISVRRDDELADLANAFNNMADSLEQLEKMRRSFVEDVSHELRTPMTTIGGFVDGILDGTIEKHDETRYLLLISEEIKRLSRMVSSMLDVAKIQSGTMTYNMKSFELTGIILKNLQTIEDRVLDKNINIITDFASDCAYVCGDEDAIYRVIFNLLDNAVKFTNDGGQIEIGMRCEPDKVFVRVRNEGTGISQKDAGYIFERFYKTDKSRSFNKKGVGIGLYLVKQIVTAHGGDIFLSSKPNEYTEFTFTLPLAEES